MLYSTVANESSFIKLASPIQPEVIDSWDMASQRAAIRAKNVTDSTVKRLVDAEYEEKLRKEAPSWFSRMINKIKGFDAKAFGRKMYGNPGDYLWATASDPVLSINRKYGTRSGSAIGALVGGLTNDGNWAAGTVGGGALGALIGRLAPAQHFLPLYKVSPLSAGLTTAISLAGQAGAGAVGGKLGAMLDKATGNHLADLTGKAEKSLGLT